MMDACRAISASSARGLPPGSQPDRAPAGRSVRPAQRHAPAGWLRERERRRRCTIAAPPSDAEVDSHHGTGAGSSGFAADSSSPTQSGSGGAAEAGALATITDPLTPNPTVRTTAKILPSLPCGSPLLDRISQHPFLGRVR
jgi:hypothetical protein